MRHLPHTTALSPIPPRRRPVALAFVAAAALAAVVTTGRASATPIGPATPAASASLQVTGHGYGHGRGMGQYGAYGYALAGWSWQQIVGHYYGGTSLSSVDPNQPVNVHLTALDGATTAVSDAAGGTVTASWAGGTTTGTQVSVTRAGAGLAVNGVPASGDVTVTASKLLQVNLPSGWRAYQGSLVVKAGSGQTWNVVTLEQYVAGVVPAEAPASWGQDGEAALEAQAVASRSYALAYLAGSPSICDSGACQVYDGDQDVAGTPTNSPWTGDADRAEQATAGQVLTCDAGSSCGPAGSVAFAEFSSSTGGETAGGRFPAVADDGDATPSNPNHSWTVSVPVSAIQSAWPGIGTFTAATVTSRNGLGDLGGRVLAMTVSGTAGSVSVTGDQFAAAVGLRSDWFALPVPAAPSGGDNGYWLAGANGSVAELGGAPAFGSMAGTRLAAPVVGMAPTADQGGYWLVGGDGGIFSFGDATFYGSTGALRLTRPVLGIAPTATGHGYWLYASDGGVFSFGDAAFHGSTGAMRLNQPVVGMASTPDGKGYWLVAADGGIFSFGDAAFYGSMGNVRLAQPIVGMVPTADGRGYTLVGRDGGIFTFGDAAYVGSLPGRGITDTVVSVAPTADGGGYLELAASGRVYAFGDAPYFGDGASGSVAIAAHRG